MCFAMFESCGWKIGGTQFNFGGWIDLMEDLKSKFCGK